MNQSYAEAGVARKNTATIIALKILMILVIIAGAFVMLTGGIIGIAGAVIVIVMVYLLPKLNVEYEYIFVDGQIDFDRITGKSRRKTMLRIDMEEVEIIAIQGSHSLDPYKNIQCVKMDFTSGAKDAKPYIAIANKNGKKYMIAFEPNELMLTMIKQKSPRKLAQY
ncbi:MAG: hypothetical protein GX757_12515 [Clostridiales bacterium]|nr:hypothetical protein [Clostridiales bacterium]